MSAQSDFVTAISSYDLFGKSLPGAFFFLGILSFLPASEVEAANVALEPTNFAILFLIILVLGLVFGQAVHTFADNIEKVFYWLEQFFSAIIGVIQGTFPGLYNILTTDGDTYVDSGQWSYITLATMSGIQAWIRKRTSGLQSTFKSHRRLFADNCVDQFGDPEEGPRDLTEATEVYQSFVQSVEDHFGKEIEDLNEQTLRELYPLITTEVNRVGGPQFRQFQAIYSFCRSMWVSLLLFAIGYGGLIFGPGIFPGVVPSTYAPWGLLLVPKAVHVFIPAGLFFAAIVFMDSSGDYKEYYIEYLLAEFSLYTSALSPSNTTREEGNRTNTPDSKTEDDTNTK